MIGSFLEQLIVKCAPHLWWRVYNSRSKSHSGSGETGPGTEQQQKQESAIKSTS